MEIIKREVAEILSLELLKFFGPDSTSKLSLARKNDYSLVTEIDHLVSKIIKEKLSTNLKFKKFSFFSEEDFHHLEFPAAVLDPIDGTNELIKGRPECVVSLALMNSSEINDPNNYAWIYNPFSGFSLDSNDIFHSHLNRSSQQILGLVSRSEWHHGFYSIPKNNKIVLVPRGSIAFKLGLLASGAAEFVISKAPKNIWDIAAGTILLNKRGIKFYRNGVEITHLEQVKYTDILLWCQPELLPVLKHEFIIEK